jgi:hypothetical protein
MEMTKYEIKKDENNDIIVKSDNSSSQEFTESDSAREYVSSNYSFIIEVGGKEMYFGIDLGDHGTIEVSTEDMLMIHEYEDWEENNFLEFFENEEEFEEAKDAWNDCLLAVTWKFEEEVEDLEDSINDDNYYIVSTVNESRRDGGYNSYSHILSDDSGYIAYDSYQEAEEAMQNEIRLEDYHSKSVVVQGLINAKNY